MILTTWGPEKTGKSSVGLSMPTPIWCADFDLGLDGALERYPGLEYESSKFPLPIELSLGVGQIKLVKELWEQFISEFVAVLEDKKKYHGAPYDSIFVDTATQMQRTVRRALLQMKQEIQLEKWDKGLRKAGEELRTSLLQIEYGEPNSKMQAIIYAPKQYQKHMCLSHYETEEYKDQLVNGEIKSMATGKMVLEGFKDTVGLSDLVILTSKKDGFYGTITHSRLHAGLEGMRLKDPTYGGVMEALGMLRGE